jgi:hypothetical protein
VNRFRTDSALERVSFRDEPDVTIEDADVTADTQAREVSLDIRRGSSAYLRLPWGSLSSLLGKIPNGDIWYAGGFSGDGKTTFLTSLALDLIADGYRIYYVPTESPPKVIRTHFACKVLGLDAGDVLTGEYEGQPDAEKIYASIDAEVDRLVAPDSEGRRKLWIAGDGFLNPLSLLAHAASAKELGADIFIVDHIDHVEGTGKTLFEASVMANKTLLKITADYGLRVLAATQFNLEAVRGKRVMRYMAPQPGYVYMGNHKRQIASGMIGLYRPLKMRGLDPEMLKAFNAGSASVQLKDILEPNTMAISVMKHRLYGQREGQRAFLHVKYGRVLDQDQSSFVHGIRTNRDVA